MASPAKQQAAKKSGSGWLSAAVAGLESRLDTILADDNEASAKARAAEEGSRQSKPLPRSNSGNLVVSAAAKDGLSGGSRDASRTRTNDRLAERLAKATAARAASNVPSRVGSPAIADSVRVSGESKRSLDVARSVPALERPSEEVSEQTKPDAEEDEEDGSKHLDDATLLNSALPINPARVSVDSSRPSVDAIPSDASSRPLVELTNGTSNLSNSTAELDREVARTSEDHAQAEKQRQEEMHVYLEKIDALQAKLTYLAKETVAAAKDANASSTAGSSEEKLAEKDERIALLMQEGEKLSKTELRHLQTIKKLRATGSETDKSTSDLRKRLDRAERAENELKQRLRKAEVAEREASEKTKAIAGIEKQVDELRIDRENAAELVRRLTTQLKEAKAKAERVEKEAATKASEVDRGKIASLENELEDAQIEKKLAEDRAASESKKVREELEGQKQRFSVRELELKSEIAGLESRVEAMRSRAEEATTEGGGGSGESNLQLLRQVETLQSQYSQAKENWETIEGSLNARLAALERERDESNRREADARKKSRDAAVKARRAEEELERHEDASRSLDQDMQSQRDEVRSLHARLEQSQFALADARADFERQRKLWESELQQRIEEEKLRWQKNTATAVNSPTLRNGSLTRDSRKTSAADMITLHSNTRRPGRVASYELAAGHPDQQRPSSRRSSAHPHPMTVAARPQNTHTSGSDGRPSRPESALSLETPVIGMPPTPSIEVDSLLETYPETPHSPDRTMHSISTAAAAGPSVQLVERMSAAVRRLESEKAAFKDEITRLSAQRDSARDEVVSLMREGGVKRDAEVGELRQRYEAALEMLGEREEEVEELRADVGELKRLYRELVERKVGGGGK